MCIRTKREDERNTTLKDTNPHNPTSSTSTPVPRQSNSPVAVFIGRWQPLHLGHEWLIRTKLDAGVPVLVMVRDVSPDQANPLSADQVSEIIHARFGDAVRTMIIPDIESVNWGRGVGYEVNEHVPTKEVHAISGTDLRMKVKEDGNWREYVDPSIWSRIEDMYGE